jgi:hypothetical protein
MATLAPQMAEDAAANKRKAMKQKLARTVIHNEQRFFSRRADGNVSIRRHLKIIVNRT